MKDKHKRPGGGRVFRSGSWNFDARLCRCAARNWNYPDFRYDDLGFRIVFKKGTRK
jgi:formylglycine-generating enzyme required for sulfatase activity